MAEAFEKWWMEVSTDPDAWSLDEFTLEQQAMLVGWCKAAWLTGWREARLAALREAGDHLIATANQYGADAVKHAKIGLKGSAEICSYLEEAFVKSANEVFRLIAPAASTSSVGAERTGTALPVDAYVNDELCMCRNCQVRRATTQTKEGKDAE